MVLIGRKPLMRYVTACITVFNEGNKTLVIKARGMAISKAVDTAEIVRRKFVASSKVKKIEIGTVQLPAITTASTEDTATGYHSNPRPKNISTIEITLVK